MTEALHRLVTALPRRGGAFRVADVPENGIYFFFENDESVTIDGKRVHRIVRVGTHRADRRLGKRLRLHYSGSRRRSVFRWHIGNALIQSGRVTGSVSAPVLIDRRLRVPDLELAISQHFSERFSFTCIPVDTMERRLRLEAGLIALLAKHPIASPGLNWLGHHALRFEIRRSGLWNTQHVESPVISGDEFALIEQLAGGN